MRLILQGCEWMANVFGAEGRGLSGLNNLAAARKVK
jgi:hypothetical protein